MEGLRRAPSRNPTSVQPSIKWVENSHPTVAYQSNESGEFEVYVQAFPQPHEKFQISTGGGTFPQWGPDGRELFYVSKDGKLTSVRLKVGAGSLEPTVPHELFSLPGGPQRYGPFDVAPDGQRFLTRVPENSIEPMNVVVNWPWLLKTETGVH